MYSLLYRVVPSLRSSLSQALLLLIGDKGYRVITMSTHVFNDFQPLVLTQKPSKRLPHTFTAWYSRIIAAEESLTLYWRRKPSIEPCFALRKELVALTDRNPLPSRGLKKNQRFLLTAVVTIHCRMIFNSIYGLALRSLATFKTLMT
jgi:hypothetical protein